MESDLFVIVAKEENWIQLDETSEPRLRGKIRDLPGYIS